MRDGVHGMRQGLLQPTEKTGGILWRPNVPRGKKKLDKINEPQLDFDGVKREAFTLFWEKFSRYISRAKQLRSTNFPRHGRNYVHQIRQNSKSRIPYGRGVLLN